MKSLQSHWAGPRLKLPTSSASLKWPTGRAPSRGVRLCEESVLRCGACQREGPNWGWRRQLYLWALPGRAGGGGFPHFTLRGPRLVCGSQSLLTFRSASYKPQWEVCKAEAPLHSGVLASLFFLWSKVGLPGKKKKKKEPSGHTQIPATPLLPCVLCVGHWWLFFLRCPETMFGE